MLAMKSLLFRSTALYGCASLSDWRSVCRLKRLYRYVPLDFALGVLCAIGVSAAGISMLPDLPCSTLCGKSTACTCNATEVDQVPAIANRNIVHTHQACPGCCPACPPPCSAANPQHEPAVRQKHIVPCKTLMCMKVMNLHEPDVKHLKHVQGKVTASTC